MKYIIQTSFQKNWLQNKTYPGGIGNKYARKEMPTILRYVNIVRDLVLNGHYPLEKNEKAQD